MVDSIFVYFWGQNIYQFLQEKKVLKDLIKIIWDKLNFLLMPESILQKSHDGQTNTLILLVQ